MMKKKNRSIRDGWMEVRGDENGKGRDDRVAMERIGPKKGMIWEMALTFMEVIMDDRLRTQTL